MKTYADKIAQLELRMKAIEQAFAEQAKRLTDADRAAIQRGMTSWTPPKPSHVSEHAFDVRSLVETARELPLTCPTCIGLRRIPTVSVESPLGPTEWRPCPACG